MAKQTTDLDDCENPRPDFLTDLGLFSLALIWGVNFPVLKFALEELTPLALNSVRFTLASLVVFIFLRFHGPVGLPDRKDWPTFILLGLLGNVVYQLLFIYGVNLTLAGNASILLATTPVWTLIFSLWAGHERANLALILGVLGTLVGMGLVVIGSAESLSVAGHSVTGDLLTIAAAIAWSIYTVGARNPIQRYGSLFVAGWTLWIGSFGLVLVGLPDLIAAEVTEISLGIWAGVGYSGAMAIGLAYIIWYRGVQKIGNSRTAVFSNLVPIVALIGAWIWLDEVPAVVQLVGAAIVIASLTMTRLPRKTFLRKAPN